MCGIVAGVSTGRIMPVLLEGLRRLEYRGYDSCGVAVIEDGKIRRARSVQRVHELIEQVENEKIDGTISHLYTGWDHSELISDDPALCIRRITRDEDGAEKMQYMAEDPADLLPVLTGTIRFDLTWLAEHYSVVIPDDQAYIIRDEDGAFVSEYFSAAYGANDGKGWVRLEIMYDSTWNLSPAYIVDGSFEEAYYYTTANGCEFLITADGDTVWASCTTAKTSVSLYGAYLTTRDLEQIVEHLSVSIAE